MKYSKTRPLLVLCATLPAVLATAQPALAGGTSMTSSRTSGVSAGVAWLEREPTSDELPLPGDVHQGYLNAYKAAGYMKVNGYVSDYECPDGVLPGDGGGHEEEAPSGCEFLGVRSLYGDSTLEFTVGRGTASLRGTLTVSNGGHDGGGQVAQAPVDMTWTQDGSTTTSKWTNQWSDGTTTYSSRYTGSSFPAALSGAMGPMRFDDDADDSASGWAQKWREQSRTRVR